MAHQFEPTFRCEICHKIKPLDKMVAPPADKFNGSTVCEKCAEKYGIENILNVLLYRYTLKGFIVPAIKPEPIRIVDGFLMSYRKAHP